MVRIRSMSVSLILLGVIAFSVFAVATGCSDSPADSQEADNQQESFTVNEYRIYRSVIDTPMSVTEAQAFENAAALHGVTPGEAERAADKVQLILFENGWLGSPESEIKHASDWTGEAP